MFLEIKKSIVENVFLRKIDRPDMDWIFDFRRVTLTPDFLNLYVSTFFEKFANKNIQVCGLESASISLISAIILESSKKDINLNGFFIRKSKKKHDLYKDIEGVPNSNPIVIVDDILNTGTSILKQIKVLKENNLKVDTVFTILRFRDLDFYDFLSKENIKIVSLFELNDFKEELNIQNLKVKENLKPLQYKIEWKASFGKTAWKHVITKSQPVLNKGKLYFGTDSGLFYCIDAETGKTIWDYKVWFGSDEKMIFSSPIVYDGKVFFGAYDGNFYCLDANTGKKIWVYSDCDWVGSSPCVSIKNNFVYIGLEYGLWKKRGGVAALDINTGKEKWKDIHESLTHCSPFVTDKNNLLFCGSNDGIVRIYNSISGDKLKEIITDGDIKMSFSENEEGTMVSFGSFDSFVYFVNTKSLEVVDKFKTFEPIYSNQVWEKEFVYITSLDKRLYKYDVKNKKLVWEFLTGARVFSSPILYGEFVYIGSNDGRMYRINKETGKITGYIQLSERIVNSPVFLDEKNYFVKTFANEIYKISEI